MAESFFYQFEHELLQIGVSHSKLWQNTLLIGTNISNSARCYKMRYQLANDVNANPFIRANFTLKEFFFLHFIFQFTEQRFYVNEELMYILGAKISNLVGFF